MSSNQRCPGLIDWNNFYNNSEIAPLRVAVIDGCKLTLVLFLEHYYESFEETICFNLLR